MKILHSLMIALLSLSLVTSCDKPPQEAEQEAPLATRAGAPLFEGLGVHQHPITTQNPDAQKYFDQGLIIDFAFNHAESVRSFQAAQALDPECAMCYWGEALALGPNINVTSNGKAIMSDESRQQAFAAIQKAQELKDSVSAVERDYIDALAARYNGDPETAREPLDMAYAQAMRDLHQQYPNDQDAASLFAEALMTTMPWDYWLDPANPKPHTEEVIAALEDVLAANPEHPLAIHLYIHAVEASSNPQRAEGHADTLTDLVPGAGHLVHMPAHIYWRVGRYHDASEANVKAAAVDEAYIAACNAQGFYPALYYPHNIHFLWSASSMEGRSEVAIDAARKVQANVRLEMIEQYPMVEFFHTIPLLALVQFGHWDEILAEPQPAENLAFSNAIWHYARATAFSRSGNLDAVWDEHSMIVPIRSDESVLYLDTVDYPASMLLNIADELVQGEMAMLENRTDDAIAHYEQAVSIQDELPYTEPPFWYYPTRQTLGRALLTANDPQRAESVFRADLKQYPRNGWSMFGLMLSLQAQGRDAEAAEVQAQFDKIWSQADVTLSSSRF